MRLRRATGDDSPAIDDGESARFRRPAGVPVSVRVDGGVSRLRLDGDRIDRLAGDRRFTSDAFTAATNRYEIEILGGASAVRVEGV